MAPAAGSGRQLMLFAGTYERFLLGFKLHQGGEEQGLVRHCTYAAHQHAVKCMAAGGHLLASGGADDQIHLYDIKHDKDMGFLMNPGDGAVPCIEFYCPPGAHGAPSHMFTGSADGSVAVWRAGGAWEHLKLMKGHTSSVNSLTVHASGRLALSVAHDQTLRMWDLAKGHSSYVAKMDMEGDHIAFSPSGNSYLVVAGNKVTVHATCGEGELLATLEHGRRVTSLVQLDERTVLAGLEDGSLTVWDVRTRTLQQSMDKAHATRIRGLAAIQPAGAQGMPAQLCSGASDGVIKLWDVRMLGRRSGGSRAAGRGHGGSIAAPACLAESNTRARITCLVVVDPAAPGPKPLAPPPTTAPSGRRASGATVAATQPQRPEPGASTRQEAHRNGKQRATVPKQQKKRPHPLSFEIVSAEQLAARENVKHHKQWPLLKVPAKGVVVQRAEEEDEDGKEEAYVQPHPARPIKNKRAKPVAPGGGRKAQRAQRVPGT